MNNFCSNIEIIFLNNLGVIGSILTSIFGPIVLVGGAIFSAVATVLTFIFSPIILVLGAIFSAVASGLIALVGIIIAPILFIGIYYDSDEA